LLLSGIGYRLRLGRLFDAESGRSFITAIDHGVTLGVPPGAEDAVGTVERIIAGGPDGVLLGPGMLAQTAHLFAHRGAPAPIVRADFFINHPFIDHHGEHYRTLIDPAAAAAMGADAIVHFLMLGAGGEAMFADNVAAVARAAQEAHGVGIPLIVEAVLWGSTIDDKKDADRLAFACRLAVEIGADAIKTEYTGDVASMRQVIVGCPAPVLVLGGAKASTPDAILTATRDAIAAGAKGAIYGRNVWQAGDVEGVSRQLRKIIHGEAPVLAGVSR
jgi:DhnA family fructose-bisphosphate aldolase class Ia